jgi:diguanylate cyclase (GGDEF)-like protein/PAS domain S-box-containing protein
MLEHHVRSASARDPECAASTPADTPLASACALVGEVLAAAAPTTHLPAVLERLGAMLRIGRLSVSGPGLTLQWHAAGKVHEASSASLLSLPIRLEMRPWGQVQIQRCADGSAWSAQETAMLRLLGEAIGAAFTRERCLAELAETRTIIRNSPTVFFRLRAEPSLPLSYITSNVSLLGHDARSLLEAPHRYQEIIIAEDRAAVQAALAAMLEPGAAPASLQFRLSSQAGTLHWVESRFAPVRDGDGSVVMIEGVLNEITERKVAEEKIAKLARSDALTGVANRLIFADRLRQSFAAARRGAHAFAVLYLDLDRFKEINDTLGHAAGDRLLQQVARRLHNTTREIDLVARLGGDEFAIIQAEVTDWAAAGTLAEKLIEIVSAPYLIHGNELRVGVSVGIALYDAEVPNSDALLAQADQALYRAKNAGRGQFRFYSDEIDHETRAHLALAEDLRAALVRGEIEIRYQPQVELASGRIVGMEALLRWNHPLRGLLLPEDFLPVAEKFGLIQQLGRWALDEACRQMSLWRRAQLEVPVVVINVALSQIKMGREFVLDVIDSLQRWNLHASDLELDVTEQMLARSTLAQSGVLEELRRLGVRIAIDDFGAQYSSLDYLRTYRVNRLKIARGMVAAAAVEPGGTPMIRAILSLAAELGVEVVAEGVETEAQRHLLVGASAHAQGQGLYFGHALTAGESMDMLRTGLAAAIAPSRGS